MPATEFDPQQFKRIIAYYRNCLAYDSDRSVILRDDDEGQTFIPLKLKAEWTSSGEGELKSDLVGKYSRSASELQQRRPSAEIMYAYPFVVRRNDFGRNSLIPVFLQRVEHELEGKTLSVRLARESPEVEVNDEFSRFIGVSNPEGKTQLYEQLGLNRAADLPPEGLNYLVRRLIELEQLPEGETLDPTCIRVGSIVEAAKNAPVLNRHALVITDRPRFTQGLDKELTTLAGDWHVDSVDSTSAGFFFGVPVNDDSRANAPDQTNEGITEVVPLNDEQRRAVQSAFHNDLTVVTGPPGTGKSQIVTTVIANAWLRRQSVLFASYNHKAVDVVEDRVNRLTSRPLMVRTGRRAGDRDLRNGIINFLVNILSSVVSDHDRLDSSDARREVERLEKDRVSVWQTLEDGRAHRNRAYQLDKEIIDLKSEQANLNERFDAAHQSREQDKTRLDDAIRGIKETILQLHRDRDEARSARDDEIALNHSEIQELLAAIESLREPNDRVRIEHPRIDADIGAEISNIYAELDSLQQRKEAETRIRDAKVASRKRKLERLASDLDPQQWARQKNQDFDALRFLMQDAYSALTAETDGDGSIWSRLWKPWGRGTRLKRIERSIDAWADVFDILGKPPAGPIVASRLDRWASYTSDALTALAEWERDAERNSEIASQIDELENEITKFEAEFDEKEFDLREARLSQSISDRVLKQIDILNERIAGHRRQIREVNDVFERKEYEQRIADRRSEIGRLSTEHETRHGAKFAELDASQAELQSTLQEKSRDFAATTATLAKMPMVNGLAAELKRVEKQVWDAGERLLDANMRVLPDRFDNDTKHAINNFRAVFEELQNDQLGGQRYRRLMRTLEGLFPKVMSTLPAWCVTNLSAKGNIPLHAGMFDLVVIDEASQCNIPSALPLLYRANRAMIIGDPNQLRHITKISDLQDQTLQVQHSLDPTSDQSLSFKKQSLFDIAMGNAGRNSLHYLREHFRSHSDIISFSNNRWYNDRLLVCTDYNELGVPSGQNAGIRWHKLKGRVERSSTYNGNINKPEAEELSEQVVDLIGKRGFSGSVGIVTPFRAQANLIINILNRELDSDVLRRCELITNTAHAFQGDERDVVFFSPCVEFDMPRGAEWFIGGTDNLFNVAITRARALLVVVGNLDACLASDIAHIKGFAEYYNEIINPKDRADEPYGFKDGPNVGHWEKRFFEALCDAGLKPTHQYVEEQYRLDFAFVTENIKLNVEVDGEMYHREWDGSRSRQDLMRDHRLLGMGWQIKRFWVYEIRDELERCVAETKELLL